MRTAAPDVTGEDALSRRIADRPLERDRLSSSDDTGS
jgi:hypothetical protein